MYPEGSATLPPGFRFHHEEPATPEPHAMEEPQLPSPPRLARLKIRRRTVLPNFEGPTEKFLASVIAADIPIPTIELAKLAEDAEMRDQGNASTTTDLLAPFNSDRRFVTPPKTPGLTTETAATVFQHPDWSRGASSEVEYFARPNSSHSSMSDSSDDDSFYSGSRLSRPSEDGSCSSPDSDFSDPFQFPSLSKAKGKSAIPLYMQSEPLNAKLRTKLRPDLPWSKSMSEHLWKTFMIYLQDPTVTPFRLGISGVPPEGVCHRVAREAKRSWKGPKANPTSVLRRSSRLNRGVTDTSDTSKSGSITPTDDNQSKIYGAWPHSGAATRSQLRELCKNDSTSVSRHRYFQSRSPTPFTNGGDRSRRRTPGASAASAFNTKDIALSLSTSTADSMQPGGPLAELAGSGGSSDLGQTSAMLGEHSLGPGFDAHDAMRSRRLGSPFIARTYGPSSSKPYQRPELPRTQSDETDSQPQLQSSLRYDAVRSLNGAHKRRSFQTLDEEMSFNGTVVRPSVLNEQLYGSALKANRRVRSRGFSLGDEALRGTVPGLFQRPSILVPSSPTSLGASTTPTPPSEPESSVTPTGPKTLLPSATFGPSRSSNIPRLGSPFSESNAHTFPRRLFQDGIAANQTVRRGAYATMHQSRRSIESFDFSEGGSSLQSRLARLDNKLAEIRGREAAGRKSGA